jgi:hypothetical protein
LASPEGTTGIEAVAALVAGTAGAATTLTAAAGSNTVSGVGAGTLAVDEASGAAGFFSSKLELLDDLRSDRGERDARGLIERIEFEIPESHDLLLRRSELSADSSAAAAPLGFSSVALEEPNPKYVLAARGLRAARGL